MNTKEAARHFVETWSERGYEKGECQTFWYQLLHDVFKIDTPADFILFELPVHIKNAKFIDAYIPMTKVLIEQKSSGEDLRKAKKQSDNEELTPYEQALRYSLGMKYSERPRWIVTCNFKSFLIYDMEKPEGEPFEIKLDNLEREYYLLRFLVTDESAMLRHEKEISIKAGELIGKLYDKLYEKYLNRDDSRSISSLNILCVRLVFCLFAEDSGLFGDGHGAFHDYMKSFRPAQMRKALIDLFKILNTPYEQRSPYEDESLLAFPFVNGGLFADEQIEIPNFTDEIADILLTECSSEFDWSGISPTIFGALFEDTMNPETREEGCMHYTSIENIHKVIDPLFMNDLRKEFNAIMQIKVEKNKKMAMLRFQEKLSTLKFLDPACGSGNFLTETYISLRRLENEILELLYDNNRMLGGDFSPIKVSIGQFYGMEINDFAVKVAKAALWIAEAQMMRETEHIVMRDMKFLPLRNYSHIEKTNALIKDWKEMIEPELLSYIIGNPPFKGKKSRDKNQKADLLEAIGQDSPRPGNMDMVTGWFLKASRYIQNTSVKVAFVSTVNITRGEQVSLLWNAILYKYGHHINFAFLPFVWNSESKKKAQVHCTIISISPVDEKNKVIYSEENTPRSVERISPYLRDEETILVSSRNRPLCDVPETGIGNKPIDHGYYLFTKEEKLQFVKKEPLSAKYFMEWYGAEELINARRRYFLWLAKCSPAELKKMPLSKERIEKVRKFRSASTDKSTRELSNFPLRFHVTNVPGSDFIVIPEVTSENRRYIPMLYVTAVESKTMLFSNLVKLMPQATLYHFGVLQSIVHMVWTKGICGYKDFRPRYSTDIVYNNFPWPSPSAAEKKKIEETARGIINARKKYPDSSLADLYDTDTMPEELRRAHMLNDRAVCRLYGFTDGMTDNTMIAELLKMYRKLKEAQYEYK